MTEGVLRRADGNGWWLATVGAALAFEAVFAYATMLFVHDRSGDYGGPLTVGDPGSLFLILGSAPTFELLPFALDTLATALVLGLLRVTLGPLGLGMGTLAATIYFFAALLAVLDQEGAPLVPPLLDHRVPALHFTARADLALLWVNWMIVALLFGAVLYWAALLLRRAGVFERHPGRD